jgi:thymidylate synthase ThyX
LSSESFTPEERRLLAPYVTNAERSIFVLTNLPEVIKGALFSRYSRSTLGLRRLLLKEFIQADEAEFGSISGGASGSAEEQRLAVERAQDFYDRILDGYGDDSIGELGGAHLAVEEVSILATKTIEDLRIGGSPLEKSTRYVSFGQKVNGDFRFYQDPEVLASRHRDRYLQACRHLFETYVRLTEPVREHVRAQLPREVGVPESAYERSVRAHGFDLIRGLLPAATLTNMGIFGNGRFFESLITRLRNEPLSELQQIAGQSWEELAQVIPSFIRRAQPGHRHFQSQSSFLEAQQQRLREATLNWERPQAPSDPRPAALQVRLVDFDPQAEEKLLSSLLYEVSECALPEVQAHVRQMSPEARQRLMRECIALREHRRHKPPRALETVFYRFEITGDYGMYRDLHRHRMLTQWRQPLTPCFGYDLPEALQEAGLDGPYREAMEQAAEAFEQLSGDFPEAAQYVVPMAYHLRWSWNVNLRALTWLVELRSTPQGHPAYRQVAQQLYREVQRVHPQLAEWIAFVDLNDYHLGRLAAEIRHAQKSG